MPWPEAPGLQLALGRGAAEQLQVRTGSESPAAGQAATYTVSFRAQNGERWGKASRNETFSDRWKSLFAKFC